MSYFVKGISMSNTQSENVFEGNTPFIHLTAILSW